MNPGIFFLYGLSLVAVLCLLFFAGLTCWLCFLYVIGKVKS